MSPPTPNDNAVPRSASSGYVLSALVLVASLLVVFVYWRGAREREMAVVHDDFIAQAEETTALLKQRLGLYELVTRGGMSLFATVSRPTRVQWQDYVDGLDLGVRFPALVGLGYAAYASSGQMSDLQRSMREAGEGLFEIRPHGIREHYGPILLLEPRTPENVDAMGFDMYSDPVRHEAMEQSMDSGQARLSGLVHLVQDGGQPIPAILLFQPVYRSGSRPLSLAARHEALQGWVYVPFRVAPFVQAALRTMPRHPAFRLFDVTDGKDTLVFDTGADPSGAAFQASTTLDRFGRQWRLDFASEPERTIEGRIVGLRPTLAVGLVASLLLFLSTLVLVRTQSRAEALAARMSESYRRSEMRFRSAMQYSAIGKGLLDAQGRIVEANPALALILGNTRDALVGTAFDAHFVDGMDQKVPGRERDSQEGVVRMTRALFRGDGVRQVHLTFSAVPGEIGQDIVRLVQVEDVTERVRAEAQILALNRTLEARVAMRTRELTQANRELEVFAYSVSHDLRAPLRSIDGFSRLLAERYADSIDQTGRDYLARVRNAAARMGELIDSLLKMSRVGRGGMNPSPLELDRVAWEVLGELRAAEPERRLDAVVQSPLPAFGDHGLVRSLMQNLLGNAWKFTRDCEEARIEVGRNASGEFYVQDNGVGFAQEYADKLFRPFQRLHSQDQFGGHGIGLASVKRIVERHGGSVRAEGVPGDGATIYFTLPEPPPE
ncbi:CHASE domain-containing protein [Cognatiluteimonas telluris]|uniref:CHASE domain-containing protein n=1 Tax=Cognatiluteimonas telluris TaxID=1104775 RepID=UPI00140D967F|nr:CHASE domain-containing protein [Lysobacter telluris]